MSIFLSLAAALTASLDSLSTNEIVFPRLGIDLHVDSVAFTVFGLSVTWYGVLITGGMLLAMIYVFSRMRAFGIDSDRAIDGIIGGIIGGVIGARAYYVAFHWSEYSGDWKAIVNIRSGGLAIYGGVIGALLIGSVVCKLRRVRLLPMYDMVALGLLIGQCIGRWGNFTNHEAFGSNTDGLFGMSSGKIQSWIIRNYPNGPLSPDSPVHPCFLYESAWCLLGFIVLHFLSKKRKFDGQVFLSYVIWYGTGRFFIEHLRTDSLYFGTVKISQIVAVVSVVTALILLIAGLSRVKRMGSDYQLYVNTEESARLIAESEQRAQKKPKPTESTPPGETVILPPDPEPEDDTTDYAEELARKKAEQQKKLAEVDALIAEITAEAEKASSEDDEDTTE